MYTVTGRNGEILQCCCDQLNELVLKKAYLRRIHLAEENLIIFHPYLNMGGKSSFTQPCVFLHVLATFYD